MIVYIHLDTDSTDEVGINKCLDNEYTAEDLLHLGICEALDQIEMAEKEGHNVI